MSFNKISGQRIPRIESLSDGVFGIAMTLLVFNLKDPLLEASASETQLWEGLCSIIPNLLAFFLSFVTLGLFWTLHATQFNYIEKSDKNLHWISVFVLMFASLIPFTTDILSKHILNIVSIFIYWINLLSIGSLLLIHWEYARKKHLLNIEGPNLVFVTNAIRRRIYSAQSLYLVGAFLSFIHPYLSIGFIIFIQLNFAFGFLSRKIQNLSNEEFVHRE